MVSAKNYAKKHGFASIQEFIKETIREKLFEGPDITKAEYSLVQKLAQVAEKENLYGTEEELFKKTKRT